MFNAVELLAERHCKELSVPKSHKPAPIRTLMQEILQTISSNLPDKDIRKALAAQALVFSPAATALLIQLIKQPKYITTINWSMEDFSKFRLNELAFLCASVPDHVNSINLGTSLLNADDIEDLPAALVNLPPNICVKFAVITNLAPYADNTGWKQRFSPPLESSNDSKLETAPTRSIKHGNNRHVMLKLPAVLEVESEHKFEASRPTPTASQSQ